MDEWDEDERSGRAAVPRVRNLGFTHDWEEDEDGEFEHQGYSYKDFGMAAGLDGFVDDRSGR